jgi:hypothetical protein
MRVMLDTQIYDLVANTPGLVEAVNALQRRGALTILCTHIQEDELASIRDATKAARVAAIQRTRAPTAGGVYGVSKYGAGTYGDGSDSGISIDEVRASSKRHTRDALIATSSSKHADVLVTEDGRLARRLNHLTPRCQVWSFSEFQQWVVAHMG